MSDHKGPEAGSGDTSHSAHGGLAALVLGAMGVVYGDIGTSPLYAMRESLHAASHDGLTPDDVLGVISLLIWTLILIVTVKYVLLVMRADNRGEGGTLSLVALLQASLARRPAWLLALGMVGVSLFFGDSIITPAMSVLSAIEGMALVAPGFDSYVVPATLTIIAVLFFFQSHGTAAVSTFFGPIMTLWFLTMGALGIMHLSDDLHILASLNPAHALGFLLSNGWASFIVIGSVFLAVTGGEALYADMGHFGRKPIRIAWGGLVFPALTLSYLGQGALVLSDPSKASNPFFLMAPEGFLLPLVILATAATVIASQAVISGAFSMMKQAVRMGLLPRLEILHTSEKQEGQIYLPQINMIIFYGVVILVLAFGSSSKLAAAYGIAVSGDMVITTLLASMLFWKVWKWPAWLVGLIMAPLLTIELLFLAANATKIAAGGYVPILMAVGMIAVMWTWVRGSQHIIAQARKGALTVEKFIAILDKSQSLQHVKGTAVFLTSDPEMAPAALMHNIKHNQVLHAQNLIVTVSMATRPYVRPSERITLNKLNDRFYMVDLSFGYMEEPNVPKALKGASKLGLKFDIMTTSFFLNRRSLRSHPKEGLPVWQEKLFISLSKSAADATGFYRLPTDRVVEIGQQLFI